MADGASRHGMPVRDLAMTADAAEAELLARFTAHPALRDLHSLPQPEFMRMLLQRRFLSLVFTVMYDIAIDALADPTAITLVREILREEYPDPSGQTPSHREDLVADLIALGATREQILGCRPTDVTATVVTETLALMCDAAAEMSDVKVLTILRLWGEILVSVEYGEYWTRMEAQFDGASARSRFYVGHLLHDGREPLATASDSSDTHSGRLGACLKRLLGGARAVEQFVAVEGQIVALRLQFYDQFVLPRS
jgi:hypothetical protein